MSLNSGYSLTGNDIFPIVLKIKAAAGADVPDGDLLSLSAKYPLTSYSEVELRTEFHKLTGHLW